VGLFGLELLIQNAQGAGSKRGTCEVWYRREIGLQVEREGLIARIQFRDDPGQLLEKKGDEDSALPHKKKA
jgi:hypothetical protein